VRARFAAPVVRPAPGHDCPKPDERDVDECSLEARRPSFFEKPLFEQLRHQPKTLRHQFRLEVRLCQGCRMAYTTFHQSQFQQHERPAVRRALRSVATLSDYFGQQHQMLEDTELTALLEPRRIQAPDGYHSTKCVSAGLFALLGNRALKAAAGLPQIPTEIAAHVVAYQVIRYRVPIYFIDEAFIRAVAATDLPHEFTLEDLHWPMPAMVVGFPARFMQEYMDRDVCYVYAANCDAGDYSVPALPGCPTITVPRSKVAWMFYCWHDGNLESFVSSYFRGDRVDETIQHYSYTDYTGIKDEAGIATDKNITDRLSALMLKLLVILNTRSQFVEAGRCVRPQRIKHGRVKHRELWSANVIGRCYRTIQDDRGGGTHASPRLHWRRGHVRNQPHGPHGSLRKPVWIEPVLVGQRRAE
jgi:hypothetical protein